MINVIKRRIAARLRPFIEYIVDSKLGPAEARWSEALRAADRDLRQSLPPPSAAPSLPQLVQLPPDLRLLHIPGVGNPGFELVVSNNPGPYDKIIIADRPYSDIAAILNMELGGRGTLIDLGANIGTIAMAVAAAGSGVIAVEMLPSNCLRLMLAALANGFPRVRVVQAAVSSTDGMLSFAGSEAWGAIAADADQQALALKLDTILADLARENPALLSPPFALKIDIEGHEYDALLGAGRFLDDHRPIVVFESIEVDEALEKTRQCKALLVSRGYDLFLLRERLLVPKAATDIQEELVGDFVAIPRERRRETLGRFTGYESRQPTTEERLRWLLTLSKETDRHRRHAMRVIDGLAQDDPSFAAAAAELRREIAEKLEAGVDA